MTSAAERTSIHLKQAEALASEYLLARLDERGLPEPAARLVDDAVRAEQAAMVAGSFVVAPEVLREHLALLTAAGWPADQIAAYLAPARRAKTPQKRAEKARHILITLTRWVHVPPAELDDWVRLALTGNIARLDRWRDPIDWWRATTAPAEGPRAFSGPAARTATLAYTDETGASGSVPSGGYRGEPWRSWCAEHAANLNQSLNLDGGRWLRHLVGCGWTGPQVLDAVGEDWATAGDTLRRLAGLDFLTAEEVTGWRAAFGSLQTLYQHQHEVLVIALAWRWTGLPPAILPWCAAAGLSPAEAVTGFANGDLTAQQVQVLAGLLH